MTRPVLTSEELRFVQELRSWRERRSLTRKALAEAMAYDPSRVSHIEGGRQPPTEEFARQAESVLRTGGALWACWEAIAESRFGLPGRAPEKDLRTSDVIAWLADHSAASFESLYAATNRHVARFEAEPPSVRYAREHARRAISRDQIARATSRYYDRGEGTERFYQAMVDGNEVLLTVLTRPGWLDPDIELGVAGTEVVRFLPSVQPTAPDRLGELATQAAVRRLALIESTETVLVNNPLYRLLDVSIEPAVVRTAVALTDFATYALTADLLEGELLDTLAAGSPDTGRVSLPLREVYLPSMSMAFDLDHRVCVGGPAVLVAIARRTRPGDRDYLLLVQERSSAVLNVPGKLAVIPKAFHQPTGEPADEAAISVTIERELEEELLGRQDLEQIAAQAQHRHVDPRHPQRFSEALAWLIERRGVAYRVDCTGFGLNMVTGNYEFACLVVIDDESWWDMFGHQVEANWEAQRIRRYSSLDTEGLAALVHDPRWSNEGLFALLQGLRRLAATDTSGRVAVPPITLET